MKIRVTSSSMDLSTRRNNGTKSEVIDTDANMLFASCNAGIPVEMILRLCESIYETYWNIPSARETVKVISLEILS